MMTTSRRRFLQGMASGGAVLGIAACAPSTSTAPTTGGATPIKSTWTVALDQKLNALDLFLSDEIYGTLGHIYEPLVDTVGLDFKMVGRLAEKWERTSDTVWRFYLRKGVKFHNGTELKAQDVEYSYLSYTDPKHPQNYRVPWFAGIKVIDDYTIDVTTKTPNLMMVWDLCRMYVMSKSAREANPTAFNDKPVGSGPYQVVNWARADRLTLKAFPDYWRGKAQPENLVIREITDPTTAASELATGGVDMVRNVDYLQATALQKNPDVEIVSVKGGIHLYSYFRNETAPFNDKRVRQAMNYAVDRQKLIDTVLLGFATPAVGPFPKGFRGYDSNIKPYPYDPVMAKKLLTEAGYPNGFKTVWGLGIRGLPSPIWKQLWEATAGQLKQVGVEVEVQPFSETRSFCKDFTPMSSATWGLTSDPITYVGQSYTGQACFHQPSINTLVATAVAAPDLEKRTAALQAVGKAFREEAVQFELLTYDLLVAKRKDVPQYKVELFANGANFIHWYDVTSLKPLT